MSGCTAEQPAHPKLQGAEDAVLLVRRIVGCRVHLRRRGAKLHSPGLQHSPDIKMYTNATPQQSSYTATTSPDDSLVLGLHARREFRPRHPWMQPGHDSIIVMAEVVLVGHPPQLRHQELAPELA